MDHSNNSNSLYHGRNSAQFSQHTISQPVKNRTRYSTASHSLGCQVIIQVGCRATFSIQNTCSPCSNVLSKLISCYMTSPLKPFASLVCPSITQVAGLAFLSFPRGRSPSWLPRSSTRYSMGSHSLGCKFINHVGCRATFSFQNTRSTCWLPSSNALFNSKSLAGLLSHEPSWLQGPLAFFSFPRGHSSSRLP